MAKQDGDDALLKEIRDRYDAATEAWSAIRDEADIDMAFVGGDPWLPADRERREKAGRPCLSIDELSQYFNQTINEVRQNPIAAKFSPKGGGASEKGSDFYADKMREIEYRSHAQQAYTVAFENAVQRSFGFVRVKTQWVDASADDPFRQEIWIEPLPNPNQFTPDPDFLRPDGSDMRYCFVEQSMSYEDFKRDWPDAEVKSYDKGMSALAPRWVKDRGLTLAEYWAVETKRSELLAWKDGKGRVAHGEKAPAGAKVIKRRPVETREVWSYLTNGVEVLSKTKHPGKYIPFACCLGKVLWTNDSGKATRTILSMTRLARDPQMLYAYYRTCEAELVGQTPRFPYFAAAGTLDKAARDDIAKSLHEPVAVIEVNLHPDGGMPGEAMPFPQRQIFEPPIQALELGAESARRAIQAAMGISPLPTTAQRRNEKSGIALQQIEASGQKGSYHFKDHYLDMIRFVGVIVEDLIDKIHDTQTATAVRRQDESSAMVKINDPNDEDAVSTQGDYLVTISTGPSNDSTQAAAEEFLDKLAGVPQVFPLIASELVKLKRLGPEGDRIAEILDMLKPPQVQAMLQAKKQGGAPDPQALMQQVGQMKEQLGAAEQVMQQLKQEADTEQAKQQATMQKAQLDAQVQIELQKMRDATSIRVAEIAASSKGYLMEAQHAAQHEEQAGALAHESSEAQAAREHEAQMAQMGHAQELETQDAAGQQKAALQDQAGQQKLQQQEVAGEQQMSLAEQNAEAQQQAAKQAAAQGVSE